MESLRALRYFVSAARLQNVTAAARALNVSQSAVSSAIAKLEQEFGLTLFDRQGVKGIILTAEGALFRDRAELLLIQAGDFISFSQDLRKSLKSEVQIGCYRTLSARFMPELVSRLSRSDLSISARVTEGSQFRIMSDLLEGRTDLAIGYDFDVSDTLVQTTLLAEYRPYALVAAEHPLSGNGPIRFKDIASEPFLLLDEPYSHQYYLGLFKITGYKPNICFTSTSHDLIRGMVARGHGYTFHNSIPQTSILYDGSRISVLELLDDLPSVRVNLFQLRTTQTRRDVGDLANFIASNFQTF